MDTENNATKKETSDDKDDQAEKQWQDCIDDELPKKRGFKNRSEYNPDADIIHQLLKNLKEKHNGKQ